jgi:hypothetical protein
MILADHAGKAEYPATHAITAKAMNMTILLRPCIKAAPLRGSWGILARSLIAKK